MYHFTGDYTVVEIRLCWVLHGDHISLRPDKAFLNFEGFWSSVHHREMWITSEIWRSYEPIIKKKKKKGEGKKTFNPICELSIEKHDSEKTNKPTIYSWETMLLYFPTGVHYEQSVAVALHSSNEVPSGSIHVSLRT